MKIEENKEKRKTGKRKKLKERFKTDFRNFFVHHLNYYV